jgi:hypothetical protein
LRRRVDWRGSAKLEKQIGGFMRRTSLPPQDENTITASVTIQRPVIWVGR